VFLARRVRGTGTAVERAVVATSPIDDLDDFDFGVFLRGLENACFCAVVVAGTCTAEMDAATDGVKLDAQIGGIASAVVFPVIVEGDPGRERGNVSSMAPSARLVVTTILTVLDWGC
jgi:hypothetical protein